MLLKQPTKRTVHLLLAHVLPQRIHGEGALAIVEVVVRGPKQRDVLRLDGIRLPHPAHESAHLLAAEGVPYDLDRGVPGQTLGQHTGSLDQCVRELTAPPLVPHLVRHDRKRDIGSPRIVVGIHEGEPLAVSDGAGIGVQAAPGTGPLHEPDIAVRVGTELLRIVVQRSSYALDHAIQVLGVFRVMEDLDRHVVPFPFMHGVMRGSDALLVPYGGVGCVAEVAAAAFRPGLAEHPRRDRDLILRGAHDGFEVDHPPCPGQEPARLDVVQRGNGRARSEPVRLPVAWTIELPTALIADRG